MLNRFNAEDILRQATGGQQPRQGETLVFGSSGWVFGSASSLGAAMTHHALTHYDSDPLDLDLIPGTLDAAKLYGSALLTALETTGGVDVGGTLEASGNLIAGGLVMPGADGVNFANLLSSRAPLINIPSGSLLCTNLDADKLDGQNGSYYLALGNATGTLGTDHGGTGLASFTPGDLLYYAAGTALSKLAIGPALALLASTGSSINWVTALVKAQLPAAIAYEDETNTFTTGTLHISSASGQAQMTLTGPQGSTKDLVFRLTGGIPMWIFRGDGTMPAVGVPNSGNDFAILSRTDAGASLGQPLAIKRDTGAVGLGGVLAGSIDASAQLQVDIVPASPRGFLGPRWTTTQRNAIGSPANGLEGYNSTQGRKNVRQAGAWAAPVTQDDDNIVLLKDRTAVPASAPSGGFYVSSNAGVPTFRTSGNKIINLDQSAAIAAPSGGSVIDVEARAAIASLITAGQARGLLA